MSTDPINSPTESTQASSAKKTRVDRWLDLAKDHPILSVVIFASIVLGGVAGVVSSIRTLFPSLAPTSQSVSIELTEAASSTLLLAVSEKNKDAWVSIEGVPSQIPTNLYESALRSTLSKKIKAIKIVNTDSLRVQMNAIEEAERLGLIKDPSEVWGTALIGIDAKANRIVLVQSAGQVAIIDNAFRAK